MQPAHKLEAPPMPRETLLRLYREMVRLRTLDERMMTLQRQGRVGFYGACTGQEAATLASAIALEANDWIFPALREGGAMLLRGFPLVPYLCQIFGNAGDETKGRQMPSHMASRSVNQVSWSSCIGTQLPQAVGAAMAARIKGDRTVVAAYLGDGATSEGDFHVAMNFAGVFKPPVVFVCQNNHWAISVPTSKQTASESIAVKAVAYGFPGVKVDGNDAVAVYGAVKEAVDRARGGGGPTLVECETYRIGAHSSSDDPTRYRDEREVELWRKRDPIERLRARLGEGGLWTDHQDQELRARLLDEVNAAIAEAEQKPDPPREGLYEDGLAAQRLLVEARAAGLVPDTLLLLEHPRVVTLGRGAKPQNVLWTPEQLRARGFELFETDRGGDVTYHGPGQLVGYPILDLKPDRKDVRKYVASVEEVLIRTAADFGVRAQRVAGRVGIWNAAGKIAAIGVHISRWITSHGFALNVSTDLLDFAAIVPCGISDAAVTSLEVLRGGSTP